MVPVWILVAGIVVLVLGTAYGIRNQVKDMMNPSIARPMLWWYVDDSQANTKEWLSFEDRATQEPNSPYLRLCLRRARELWSKDFEIVPVIGRRAALAHLSSVPEGAGACPPALWMAWCQSAFLSQKGGLWVDGSVLPIGTGPELINRIQRHLVLTFGSDPDEDLVVEGGAAAAGRSAGWAATPGHPMWSGLQRDTADTIALGPQSWSSFEARRALRFLWDKHCSGVTEIDRKAEVSRDRFGKRLGHEDLFDLSEWPTGSTEGGLWVPLPFGRDGLERASTWLWFTRLSEQQIVESDFLWSRLATRS
jgi:hypothetical protein